jgi:hypothetical protein
MGKITVSTTTALFAQSKINLPLHFSFATTAINQLWEALGSWVRGAVRAPDNFKSPN